MRCPNCQRFNSSRAKFCLDCGIPFTLPCSNCHSELPASARFCSECGNPLAGPTGRISLLECLLRVGARDLRQRGEEGLIRLFGLAVGNGLQFAMLGHWGFSLPVVPAVTWTARIGYEGWKYWLQANRPRVGAAYRVSYDAGRRLFVAKTTTPGISILPQQVVLPQSQLRAPQPWLESHLTRVDSDGVFRRLLSANPKAVPAELRVSASVPRTFRCPACGESLPSHASNCVRSPSDLLMRQAFTAQQMSKLRNLARPQWQPPPWGGPRR
jgi:hypothetical protein